MDTDNYVYDNIEVVKTGRTAIRTTSRKKIILIEIKPANTSITSANQWVKEEELYKIEE